MQINESNSPELGHAPKHNKPSARLTIWGILLALVIGVITGTVGTVLHLNSFWTGSFGIPWGVAVALVVAGLAQWWIGLRTANIIAPGLTGIAQYATLAVFSTMTRGDIFTVPITAETWQFVPHLVIANLAWHIGLIVLTMIIVVLLNRTLRRTRDQLTASDTQSHPAVHVGQNR